MIYNHPFRYLKCPLIKPNQKSQLRGYFNVQATHVICDLGQGLLTPRLGVNGAGPIQFLSEFRITLGQGDLVACETRPLYGPKYVQIPP